MPVTNLTPVAVAGQPPVIVSIKILPQSSPGIWQCLFTYSDGSTLQLGLITKNVQYWIDNLAANNVTDASQNTFAPFAQPVGTTNVETQQSRVVNIAVSDNTVVKAS